jgi:phosphocarrier protein HPr
VQEQEGPVVHRSFTLRNKQGFHARAATRFVQLVNHFQAAVEVEKDGQRQDGRSVVGMLMLLAGKGSSIVVRCQGHDSAALLDAVAKLVEDGFGE